MNASHSLPTPGICALWGPDFSTERSKRRYPNGNWIWKDVARAVQRQADSFILPVLPWPFQDAMQTSPGSDPLAPGVWTPGRLVHIFLLVRNSHTLFRGTSSLAQKLGVIGCVGGGGWSWCLLFPFYPPPSFLPHSALFSRKTQQPKIASALTLNFLNCHPTSTPQAGEFPSPLFLGLSCDTDGHTDISWLAPPLRYHRYLFSSEVINHRTLPCISELAVQARNAERSSCWFSSPDLL